jgi:hypothetical protein
MISIDLPKNFCYKNSKKYKKNIGLAVQSSMFPVENLHIAHIKGILYESWLESRSPLWNRFFLAEWSNILPTINKSTFNLALSLEPLTLSPEPYTLRLYPLTRGNNGTRKYTC